MNAVLKPQEAQFQPMTTHWLGAVLAIEMQCYSHPWSRGNFVDSLQSHYAAQLLTAGDELLGYFVALQGVDEVHLLNITVAPAYQGQGWARVMLDAITLWSRGLNAQWLWLEVRHSNTHAQQVYEHCGFRRVGLRKNYYPGHGGQREDAVLMSFHLQQEADEAAGALT
jgi:[ribosomal protein S18]-alanine N-acetyltransferase